MTAAVAPYPKVAFVTGGASGIGRATARLFANSGVAVAVADLDPSGEDVANEISASGVPAAFFPLDISDSAQVRLVVDAVVARFGRLDYAFNNAGVEAIGSLTADCDDDVWHHTIDVDLSGTFYCVREELRQMAAQGGGSIVNTASALGLVGVTRQPAYVAAKHGVVGLTRAAALDYADRNIRVNCVCPGLVDTPMVQRGMRDDPEIEGRVRSRQPMQRLGRPEEIAEAVLWLCTSASSFVTGHALAADGGYVIH